MGWFGYSVSQYYRAIQSGETNPLLQARLESSVSTAIANTRVTAADLARLDKADAPSIGSKDAKLVIVEFLDFNCPFCRASFEPVRELTSKYSENVRLVIRDFPIEEIHPGATRAAHAARCVNEQGKYWAYHDKLFLNQDTFSEDDLRRYAVEVGADEKRFQTCMQENRYLRDIEADIATGLQTGVGGTPTFFFNGKRVQGALNHETLEFIIKEFLKQLEAAS
jgi:protein-disulfide isomerase